VNGKTADRLEIAVFRVDVTNAIAPATKRWRSMVANLWPKRLIGDSTLPESQRTNLELPGSPIKPDDPLLKSGLLGPVTLERAVPAP